MKNHVTDGQLGQLAVKQHELFGRAKRGVYESIDEVLAAVQRVIEGKEPIIPTLSVDQKFAKWRTFIIGGFVPRALLSRVETGCKVGDGAKNLMRQVSFTTRSMVEEGVETIILTPADFGYERQPTVTELLDPTRLAEWSKQNAHRLPADYVVELLPAEAGPHIRDQYKDQLKYEVLWIAMKRIADSNGNQHVFGLERSDDGERKLHTGWMHPDDPCSLDRRLVFRLRKVEPTASAA